MSLSDYEDALKSFLHDDDKMVTYKWLSKEFEIHVNLAKDILKQYWEKYKHKEKLVATVLLVGQLQDGSIHVTVVKESDFDSAKKKFVKINCEHLYSIQKSLPDIGLLALVGGGDLRYSAIKCNEEYIRSEDEIESLRYIGNVRAEEVKPVKTSTTINKADEKPIPKKVEISPVQKPKKHDNKKDEVKEKPEEKADTEPTTTQDKKKSPPNKAGSNNSKPNNKTSKKPVQSKQSGFNNLFGKVQSKPPTPANKPVDSQKDTQSSTTQEDEKASAKETSSTEEKEKVNKSKSQEKEKEKLNKTKSLEKEKEKLNKSKSQEKEKEKLNKTKSLEKEKEKLNKTKSLEKEKEKLNKTKSLEKEKEEIKEKENVHSQEKSKKIKNIEDETEKSKPKSKTDARGKKRNRSQEKNSLSKRKRIVVQDSSEDESGRSEDEEAMVVEEEPPKVVARRSPSPPAEKRENGKRMVRKTIDKSYKDDDGFVVTKRYHVYEAASDSEATEVIEPPKPKAVEPQAKKKQTTLMNFFKKS